MKKVLALLLALSLMFVVGCRTAEAPVTEAPTETPATEAPATDAETPAGEAEAPATEVNPNWKIGIVTGTVSQGEEEYQAAQQMVAKYGADRIVTATYPDKFNEETETTIANIASLASDPDVQAIIICQSVPGTAAAIDKVRETRPEILFIAGVVAEAPKMMSEKADFIMQIDEIGMGTNVPTQAKSQGAETFIHYSFARHLSYETIAARHDLMKAKCEELGIEFVDVSAPDPTGDAGVGGAQQFILEDVPRQVAKYGKNVAFFSTNCSMMEPLIRSVAEQGAIFPQQCCPSPYHGYPAAFGIEVPEGKAGDVAYMLEQTKAKIAEAGNEGRMSTWPVPVNMIMIEAATEYAIKFAAGEVGRADLPAFEAEVNKIADCQISIYESKDDGVLDNYYMILSDFYNF